MSFEAITCPTCGSDIKKHRNPFPTVDIIIELNDCIVLIQRKNPPLGWALPGGFVDYGEKLEQAAIREAREETSLDISNLKLLGCYSDPKRDTRMHTVSTVFVATGHGTPCAADDAASLRLFRIYDFPDQLCFDHGQILADYLKWKSGRQS